MTDQRRGYRRRERQTMENMKKGKKMLIPAVATILVILAAGLAVIIRLPAAGGTALQRQLELGQRYLEELDYEQALAAFMGVLEIDPVNADAYLGAIEAYVRMGEDELAMELAGKGYEVTGDIRIREQLERLRLAAAASAGAGDSTPEDGGSGEEGSASAAGSGLFPALDSDALAAVDTVYRLMENRDYFGLMEFINSYDGGSICSGDFYRNRLQGMLCLYDGEAFRPYGDGEGLLILEKYLAFGRFRVKPELWPDETDIEDGVLVHMASSDFAGWTAGHFENGALNGEGETGIISLYPEHKYSMAGFRSATWENGLAVGDACRFEKGNCWEDGEEKSYQYSFHTDPEGAMIFDERFRFYASIEDGGTEYALKEDDNDSHVTIIIVFPQVNDNRFLVTDNGYAASLRNILRDLYHEQYGEQ